MRRRFIGNMCTGLGNSSPEIFDNKWLGVEEFDIALKTFFNDVLREVEYFTEFGGFDFAIKCENGNLKIVIGIEPAYKHDAYVCFCVDGDRNNILIQTGHANGYYGSNIKVTRTYDSNTSAYKQFKNCVDKHFEKLMSIAKQN